MCFVFGGKHGDQLRKEFEMKDQEFSTPHATPVNSHEEVSKFLAMIVSLTLTLMQQLVTRKDA